MITKGEVRGLEARVIGVAVWSTVAALVAAFAIYQLSNWAGDRQDLADDTLSLGRSIASLAHAAVADGDAEAHADIAGLLIAAPHVKDVAVFTADGQRLDIGVDNGRFAPLQPRGGQAAEVLFQSPGVVVHIPRYQGGQRVGELVLRADDAELVAVRLRNIVIAALLSFVSTLIAAGMAQALARRALKPLKTLNQAVEELTGTRDLSARVAVESHDEVGQLTANYNRLLDALERRDAELRRALDEIMEARDAAEEANTLKSQFLSNMAHEIRTPLNGVLGMARALLTEEMDPVRRERVEVIRDSGAALLCVLNDLLDLAQLETGALALETAPFELEAVVRDACAVAVTLAESKKLAFAVEVAPDAAGRWEGDAVRLRQVLYNLASNALKFTAAGRVTVRAACEAATGALVLTVSDTGIGISAELMPRLFGKFVQGDAGATRRFGGAGLGLAICKDIVELMGGEIEVESAQGAGSTFTVRLPLRRAEEAAAEESGAVTDLASLRVLVAEDNETNQRVVRTVLNALGVDPVIVPDGVAAVDAWLRERFDLVLMDIQMPVKDGVTATRDIRRLEAERGIAPTRIVALTANAMPQQAAEYAAAGMDGLVPKPIMIEKLHAALVGAAPTLKAA